MAKRLVGEEKFYIVINMEQPRQKTRAEIALEQELLRRQYKTELYRQKMMHPYPSPFKPDYESAFSEPPPPKAEKIKCVKCKKTIAIEPPEEQLYPGKKVEEKLYCPTCWKIKKLKE
jgi:hypothetical protein